MNFIKVWCSLNKLSSSSIVNLTKLRPIDYQIPDGFPFALKINKTNWAIWVLDESFENGLAGWWASWFLGKKAILYNKGEPNPKRKLVENCYYIPSCWKLWSTAARNCTLLQWHQKIKGREKKFTKSEKWNFFNSFDILFTVHHSKTYIRIIVTSNRPPSLFDCSPLYIFQHTS